VYLSTTAEYSSVSNSTLSGIYAVARIGTDEIPCQFADFWSINACADAEQTAAEVMLSYFYTASAQDHLYSRQDATALPVNKTALNKYVDVYDELSGVP